MKLFVAGLATETNTFSPIAAGRRHWFDIGSVFSIDKLVELAEPQGWQVSFGPIRGAHPAGITPRSVYETERARILDALISAGPVDAVLLILHGAMVANGYPDCEGDLICTIRDKVGPGVPIGVELDLHAHLSDAMLENADLLVGFKEYPHTDIEEQLLYLFALLADVAEGRTRPVMRSFECRMLHLYPTTAEPMRAFVESLRTLERQDRVLNAWLCHGFPWSDVKDAGARMLVTTDGDPQLAESLAEEYGKRFYSLRSKVARKTSSFSECIETAESQSGPVTIADTADNPGGGAPGDSTFVLRELIERRVNNVAVGPLFDPGAVGICHDAGKGEVVQLRIGGKLGTTSGDPIDVVASIIGICDDITQSLGEGLSTSLGPCAAIRIHLDGMREMPACGIDVVLGSERAQAFAPNLFSDIGIDPTSKQILVVKSTQHFYAAFEPISNAILYAGDQGALQDDFGKIPYENLDVSRLWPIASNPLGLFE